MQSSQSGACHTCIRWRRMQLRHTLFEVCGDDIIELDEERYGGNRIIVMIFSKLEKTATTTTRSGLARQSSAPLYHTAVPLAPTGQLRLGEKNEQFPLR